MALRQRDGRILTGVFGSEADGMAFARSRIATGATVVADETPHWDLLGDAFDVERINHSDAYSFLGGIHVNGAESYFARLRRMIRGQHHRVSPSRLGGYAAHAAWLEDHRRQSNGALVAQLIGDASSPPRLAASGRAIGDAQRDRRTCSPDAHTFALVDHHDELAPSGMPQGLNDLEDDRVAQRSYPWHSSSRAHITRSASSRVVSSPSSSVAGRKGPQSRPS